MNKNREPISFLNQVPMYISELIDKFIFKIPKNIQNYLVKIADYIKIIIGCIIIYVPFVYLFQRDYDLNDDILSFN